MKVRISLIDHYGNYNLWTRETGLNSTGKIKIENVKEVLEQLTHLFLKEVEEILKKYNKEE